MLDTFINIYIIGLLVYTVLCLVDSSGLLKIQDWLGRFYLPLLTVIRTYVKPVDIGGKRIDLSPLVLIVVIVIARRIVFLLLFNRMIFI
jgi:uncharacterized protein YggT (Ycf19 family)